MIAVIKTHKVAIILALAVGLIIISPTIAAVGKIGEGFRGIYPMFSNDEDQYLSMTGEVYNGHYNLGSPYLKEHKDAPYLQQPLAEIIFAKAARLFNISVPKLFAVNDFLLPFMGVILLYTLVFSLTDSIPISNIFSASYYLLFIYWFNRPINPQFSFLFLFFGLFLIWKIIINENRSLKKIIILNGLLALDFGAAFYIYPFVWSSILVVYGLVVFWLAVKERAILFYAKNFLAFIIPAAIFSIPYILNLSRAALDPSYIDENLRFGFLFNHFPGAYFNVAIATAGLLIAYLSGQDADRKRGTFIYSLGISGILLNWQNVITGKAFSFSIKKLGFEKSLKQYAADYILLDENDIEFGHFSEKLKKMKFLTLSAELGNNLIFKVNR